MIKGDGLMERFGTEHLFHLGRKAVRVRVRLVGTAQQLPESAKKSPSALGDTGPGALEPFYGSAGKGGEDGSLRMHASHLEEVGGDVNKVCETMPALRFGQDCVRMVRTVHSDRCLKVTLLGDCSASGRDNPSSEMSLHRKASIAYRKPSPSRQ
ncbi:hypothetical protein TNCV_4299071 [Trichonephila clavipes]|nr:hypothetical protein TNCV_4299071 [Trichonephila clavipes]